MVEPIDFSLTEGGLLGRLMQRFGVADRVLARVVLALIVTWLPLLILSIVRGLAAGKAVKIPFLGDYGVYGRFLVAIPVLILAEISIHRRSRDVIREFTTSRLIREQDTPSFNDAVREATERKQSITPEIIILGLIYAFSAARVPSALADPLSTWYRADGGVTPAGLYYVLVSLPLFQFLLIRWIWKLALWTSLLWRISRMDLQLLPIHPDKMGGLGFIGLGQIPFGLIGFAGGATISAYLANAMVYHRVSLLASSSPMVVYLVLAVLAILAPVLVFTDKLVTLRANGIFRYGDVGQEYARLFDQKWVQNPHPDTETILGTSDIQSLADLKNSFDIIQDMSIIAADRKTITVIAATAAIPMIPLFLIALPFQDIIARLLGIAR